MQSEIRLEIHADPICPWCLIGKAWLDRALEGAAHHPFAVEWHPFQLNPDMPAQGMDRVAYLEAKFGGQMGAAEALRPLLEAAAAAGIPLDLPAIERTPNTLDAHRVIHWAGLEGRQTPVMGALMRGYFCEGRDLGDPATLADIAGRAGMDRAVVARLLASDADRAEVADRDAAARARGISAVPTFIVAGTYVLTGAQPVALWREVLSELAERGA